MKPVLCLIAAAALAGVLSGCEATVYERQTAYVPPADGYYPAAPVSYRPVKTYSSEWDYYRHYNGING
jgi:hypothetical protein